MNGLRKKCEQARNAGSLDRQEGNQKQIIQQLFAKYRGEIMKTNMGFPEIDFVICEINEFFLKFCYKEIGKTANFVSKKV